MALTVQEQYEASDYSSPYDRLLEDQNDISAWIQIFGFNNLNTKKCTILIREVSVNRYSRKGDYSENRYDRRSLAYC